MIDHLSPENIRFADHVEGWRDAIELVSEPLLESGAITRQYVDAMLASIAAGGTYIDLGYGIALAHSRPEHGVLDTGLSALWVRPAVLLNDEPAHPITLFFCLAATDSSSHLATMAKLGELLTDDAARNSLLAATTTAEVMAVLNAGEHQ
ncbi:PTS sugar transporter subunit IIA [Pseudoclavibacter sp. RFBJ3]|uniref:PTS sugar transporter subunit IIA n=1 Tax=unclassified Pseudoclavibacter TaxID=2615177 RepID=UPI000CE8C1AE|nr:MULTISPECIES: PTS sugar transporter subunit IIA [unclassified Pseudoclavibacter]PPF80470.1 PTS sugar transporter subunit IIA [Pseudoclavibacter sp. RFBJ5]PPF90183.1 PTS sugar transporter subunit IIA [Pseudoclavibacter sp. RFBJ3]PPG00517.1 PTS sugar transporter subunit IIA [Pseudoclavibacter sp. RFBH5]PPG19259.1 PTS sugar transporter subunit IIA [Pseudoclavibacter sp. RFBI4]